MLSVKYFIEELYKLKGFLMQIKIKITNKGLGLPTVIKQVAYIELFLLGRALEWFKPYFTEIQKNGLTTTNQEVQYIFLLQEGFCKYIIQIFSSSKEELITKDKFKTI